MALIGILLIAFGWFVIDQGMDLMIAGFKMIIKYLKD